MSTPAEPRSVTDPKTDKGSVILRGIPVALDTDVGGAFITDCARNTEGLLFDEEIREKWQLGPTDASPFAQYLDLKLNLQSLQIPYARFPGTKMVLPDREAVCAGWSDFITEVAPDPAPVIESKGRVPYYIAGWKCGFGFNFGILACRRPPLPLIRRHRQVPLATRD
jgi:hypothetical protein